MHSHEYSAPQSPGARTFPRASGLETSRFRAQSTFRRVRNPHHLRGDCYVACVRGVPSRLPRTYLFAFSPQRSAFSTLRRFLLARHSLGSCPREPAPEWCRDTSNRRLPPSLSLFPTAPVLTSLELALGLASVPFEGLFGSRRPTRFSGTARSLDELFAHRSRGDLRLLRLLSQSRFSCFGLSAERARS
jgi:hypothetical protein